MPKEKKPSRYARKPQSSNIVPFAAERAARSYRVMRSGSPTSPTLEIITPYPEKQGGEKSVNITFLLDFPNLSDAFSEALSENFRASRSPYVTVTGKCTQLKNGFFAFLKEAAPNAELGDISTAMVESFIVWLRRSENGVAKYKKITKQQFMITFKGAVDFLQASDKWKAYLDPDLSIRNNIWRDEPDDRKQIEIIPEALYRDIYVACKQEIIAKMAKVRAHRALMEKNLDHDIALQGDRYPHHAYTLSGGVIHKVWAANPYKDLGLCLASLRNRVPNVILSITELEKMQDKMLLNVVETKKPFGSIPGLYFCFYPYTRDLVPFVLMLAIHFDYNPETLMKSLLSD